MVKEQIKSLWQLCFDDSEEFVDMYFRLRYNNEVNVAIESSNEVIAALQTLPYPMTFCGSEVQTSYISGACTHPDYRGNGVMKELLLQAFAKMLRNEVFFSTLIPAEAWLFDYYARMGYAPVFHYSRKTITVPDFIPSKNIAINSTTDYQEDIYKFLNAKMAARPFCIQHTEDDFKVILSDLAISDGNLFFAIEGSNVTGVAVSYIKEGVLEISELLAESKEAENSLLHYISQTTGFSRLTLYLPPNRDLQQSPFGMARIIDVKSVLQLYAAAYPEDEMQLELTDKQLSSNNGYYYLCKGKCRFNKDRLPGVHLQMNIRELADRIFQPLQPYMSLMTD